MERITFLVGRCTIYEKLYLTKCDEGEEAPTPTIATKTATSDLPRALVRLYTAILKAMSQCLRASWLYFRIGWHQLTPIPGKFLENLGSLDAIPEEITALDALGSEVNLAA